MILKVFELKPKMGSYGSSPRRSRPTLTAELRVISPGTPGMNYTFVVGTRTKPTNRDRERIERAIAGAWSGIFDPQDLDETWGRTITPPPYGVTIVPDSSLPTGETVLPQFVYNGFFIVFALMESETAVSEDEEREVSESIAKAIGNQVRDMKIKPRIGVVTLYNCSVHILEGQGYQ